MLTNEKNTYFGICFSNLLYVSLPLFGNQPHKQLAYEYRKLTRLFLEILIFKQIRQYATKAACIQTHFYAVPKYVFL